LDLKSGADHDLFQFMTPSMLVKLADLRNKKKIIFIIATNYEERIDKAIKRVGRIDKEYLVLPPDKNRRKELLSKFITEKNENHEFIELMFGKPNKIRQKEILSKIENPEFLNLVFNKRDFLKRALKETALYTYTEFKQLSEEISRLIKNGNAEKDLEDLLNRPSITLTSYKDTFKKNKNNIQKPFKEFFSLVFLKAETSENENDDELIWFKKLLTNEESFIRKAIPNKTENEVLEKIMKEYDVSPKIFKAITDVLLPKNDKEQENE